MAATLRISGLSLLRGRRGVALALLCLLPLIAPGRELLEAGAGTKGGVGFLELLADAYLHRIGMIVALFVGCGALGEEIDGKTLPYLLTRPVPRSALLVGRWIAAIGASWVLLAGALVVAYLATVGQLGLEALAVDLPLLGFALAAVLLALVVYGAVFVLLSVLVRWPLLVGLALVFVWEEFASALPGEVARFTLVHHLYALLAVTTGSEHFVRLARPDDLELLPAATSLQVLFWTCAAALSLALLRFRRKPYLA